MRLVNVMAIMVLLLLTAFLLGSVFLGIGDTAVQHLTGSGEAQMSISQCLEQNSELTYSECEERISNG